MGRTFIFQNALVAAAAGSEIWVAAGTYKPTTGTDRSAAFQLKNGVALYGGFASTETSRDQRDWETNFTILSGDIGAAGDSDNSYHVVTGSGTDATAVLDGFTVTVGNADGSFPNYRGGGMLNESGSPTLSNLIFSGNSGGSGGGMFNDSSNPTLINVVFSGNIAGWGGSGGGMQNSDSSPVSVNVTFSGNSASDEGGGMANYGGSSTLANCILWGNTAPAGSQISNYENTTTISSSLVQGSGGSGAGWDASLGTDGGGNLDEDPLFLDPPDNLRLQSGSPAIDAGDNAALPADTLDLDGDGDTGEPIPVDLAGNPRIVNGIVDMGAYEYRDVTPVYLPLILKNQQ